MKELILLITESDKCTSVFTKLIELDDLKFKERDELEDIFNSWSSKVDLDIEKLRDQRCRAHYKDRFDYRVNLVDWDY